MRTITPNLLANEEAVPGPGFGISFIGNPPLLRSITPRLIIAVHHDRQAQPTPNAHTALPIGLGNGPKVLSGKYELPLAATREKRLGDFGFA
jgi:hypothetical protein